MRTLVRVPDLVPELKRLFGFDAFRPGQEAVVRAAVEGRDTLALMPTGAGKSLTYQLAAMLRPTPTLVVSPLIALMKDQVDKLPAELAEQATLVNSSLEPDEAARRVLELAQGRYKLLYAAPERLRQRGFLDALRSARIGLVVVDEVHCVSMWGHDFRPDYLFIRQALDALDSPSLLGMTATATPAIEREISAALGREPEVVRTSIARPNLHYDVVRAESEEERLRALIAQLHAVDGASAIVYARSRRSCETLARTLRQHKIEAAHYHAGLDSDVRSQTQEDFIEGRVRTVVATTAFGMGIDKPDIRLVLLYNFPDSLESYVQMVGRAGRDGRESHTVLLAGAGDARSVEKFARGDVPSLADLRAVYRALRDAAVNGVAAVQPSQLDAAAGSARDTRVLVGMLEQAGLVRRGFDRGRTMEVELVPAQADAAEVLGDLLDRYERESVARARLLVDFAEQARCRHGAVAEHFGETHAGNCGMCDVCAPGSVAPAPKPEPSALPEDVGAAIHAAVAALHWPLGRTGLVNMLRGSVAAPPSARRSPAFGLLAAATQAEVGRWVKRLEEDGALESFESEDGFRLLRAGPASALPRIATGGSPDESLFERLRTWRSTRARDDSVPAYVVLHDATLRELATAKPSSTRDLAAVKGFGPTKIERYGDDVLAVISAAHG